MGAPPVDNDCTSVLHGLLSRKDDSEHQLHLCRLTEGADLFEDSSV